MSDTNFATEFLVLGGNGLAGSAIIAELRRNNRSVRFASRNSTDIKIDASDYSQLKKLIEKLKPHIVINCAAEVDFARCEADYYFSWKKNVGVVANLCSLSQIFEFKLVQISTDHYFVGASKERHSEESPVTLVNAYAKQKYCAEIAASLLDKSLILRTAFTGNPSSSSKKETFWSWVKNSLEQRVPVTLFSDAFTSMLDKRFFSMCLVDLINAKATGIYNVASADVYSKEEFFWEAANQIGVRGVVAKSGSIRTLEIVRANNLGLCTKKIETLLGYQMPRLDEVIANLIADEKNYEV